MSKPIKKSDLLLGSFKQIIKSGILFFDQLLFPGKCLKCGVYLDPEILVGTSLESCFCASCFGNGVVYIKPPFCTQCGKVFEGRSGDNHTCESCLKHPLFLGQVRGCAAYEGALRVAVPLFKYSTKKSLASVFEKMMIQGYERYFSSAGIDLVIPMPLHGKKVIQRGFNQAYLMVRNLRQQIKKKTHTDPSWQMDLTSLNRVKMTAPQTGFDFTERKRNLKNAFVVAVPERIKGRYILLIDDVYTTGATCNEAAKTLLKAGAQRVDALVLARA